MRPLGTLSEILVSGVLLAVIAYATPASGQVISAPDVGSVHPPETLNAVVAAQRYQARITRPTAMRICRERSRAFRVRNQTSPSERRQQVNRCVTRFLAPTTDPTVAQTAAPTPKPNPAE